ncbi:MAG: phosphoribosylformylglycinamidine cyclo-ligase [Elusimicrobiota bacterium]
MNEYKKSGVDVEKAENLVKGLSVKFPSIGGYAGVFPVGNNKMAATCDGVGTKIRLAVEFDRHETVGEDLVAMSINDLIAGGAQPLFFLDYFSCGRLDEEIFNRVLKGIENGLSKCDCALIGGETAEMPDMYKDGDYDLAGFACGLVRKEFNKNTIKTGDLVIGVESNGIHSNGFSLVRKLFSKEDLSEHIDTIMRPTRIYSEFIFSETGEPLLMDMIKSMAHVTGGGIERALKRLLPDGIGIDMADFEIPEIYKLIEKRGMTVEEMKKVFNVGWGMLLVISPEDEEKLLSIVSGSRIGKVR